MYFPNPTLIRLMLFVSCARNVVLTQLDQNWTSFHASEMQTRHSYDKIFQKIWGASGQCFGKCKYMHFKSTWFVLLISFLSPVFM